MIIKKTVSKTMNALTEEVERLNSLREAVQMNDKNADLVKEAIEKMGEAFHALDAIL